MPSEEPASTSTMNLAKFTGQMQVEYNTPPDELHWGDTYHVLRHWAENYNRESGLESIWMGQEAADERDLAASLPDYTTISQSRRIAMGSLMRSSELLKDATIVLFTESVSEVASQILTRSAYEAMSICWWLIQPELSRDERLRRTSIYKYQSISRGAALAPRDDGDLSEGESTVDNLELVKVVQDSLLSEARIRGWSLANGKPPSHKGWNGEFPGFTRLVVECSQEDDDDYSMDGSKGRFMYGMLSGQVHNDFLQVLMTSQDRESLQHLTRVFLASALQRFGRIHMSIAEVMGWDDHSLDDWFAPIFDYFRQTLNVQLTLR